MKYNTKCAICHKFIDPQAPYIVETGIEEYPWAHRDCWKEYLFAKKQEDKNEQDTD
jgi:hypothetical protein